MKDAGDAVVIFDAELQVDLEGAGALLDAFGALPERVAALHRIETEGFRRLVPIGNVQAFLVAHIDVRDGVLEVFYF